MKAYRAYHFDIYPIEKTPIFSAWLTTFPFESFITTETGVTAYVSLELASNISPAAFLAFPFDGLKVSVKTEDFEGQNYNAYKSRDPDYETIYKKRLKQIREDFPIPDLFKERTS